VTVDRLADTVREQVALGRLLPLGGPGDAVWITERAAVRALRRACAGVPGVRLRTLAAGPDEVDRPDEPDDPDGSGSLVGEEAGPADRHLPAAAPLGALPHQPLRIEAAFDAAPDEPLPVSAERLREALFAAAADGVGLPVARVDLRVTGLLDGGDDAQDAAGADAEEGAQGQEGPAGEPLDDPVRAAGPVPGPTLAADRAEPLRAAVAAVPGVLRLTRELAGIAGLRVRDARPPQEPARRVQIQLATAPGFPPLDVARRAAAAAVSAAQDGARGPVTAAVVVTAVG
jgi:hypothetical protein